MPQPKHIHQGPYAKNMTKYQPYAQHNSYNNMRTYL
jgi:hypothetical protein